MLRFWRERPCDRTLLIEGWRAGRTSLWPPLDVKGAMMTADTRCGPCGFTSRRGSSADSVQTLHRQALSRSCRPAVPQGAWGRSLAAELQDWGEQSWREAPATGEHRGTRNSSQVQVQAPSPTEGSREGGLLKTPPESPSGFLEMNPIVVSFSRSKFSFFAHRGDTVLKGEVLSGRTQEDSVLWDPILF